MEGKKYLTKTALLERGWTSGAVRKFLGQADKTSPNPYSRKKPPVQLFEVERVKLVEESAAFAEWKQKVSQKRQSAQQAANKKKQAIEDEKSRIAEIWKKLEPLADLRTSNWTGFEWGHFGVSDCELTDKEKEIAVNAVKKMLQKSYWVPVDLFLEVFKHWGLDAANTDRHAAEIAESLAKNGWQGIPFVSFFLQDKVGRIQLDSGHHRFLALRRLRESGTIDAKFRVPVFDLQLMPSCFKDQKLSSDAREALSYVENSYYSLALKIYGRENWMLGLCSGIDY